MKEQERTHQLAVGCGSNQPRRIAIVGQAPRTLHNSLSHTTNTLLHVQKEVNRKNTNHNGRVDINRRSNINVVAGVEPAVVEPTQ